MIGPHRRERVTKLTQDSHALLDEVLAGPMFTNHEHAGTVVLFSGGNDSTVLAHLMRDKVTHAAHANTTIGIEQTRQYVRDTCHNWGLPLLEFAPNEGDDYRSLVLSHGFPGPAHHWKMYQRLKERALRKVRRELVSNGRKQRVIFLAGRRRSESNRRANVPQVERDGAVVWVSPLTEWTSLDMNAYRQMQGDVPVNEVSVLLHMSGECLCGAFAKADELAEIGLWFPAAAKTITDLEAEIADRTDIPDERKRWGWGATRDVKPSKSGPMCSSCEQLRLPVDNTEDAA